MRFPLHQYRLCDRLQHHHVSWHSRFVDKLRGLHWQYQLATNPRYPASAIEVFLGQIWPRCQPLRGRFLHRRFCLRFLPSDAEPTRGGNELGHCRLWRSRAVREPVFRLPRETRLCWTGGLRGQEHIKNWRNFEELE